MSHSVLDRALRTRRDFDPSRKEDLAELRYFIDNAKWRNGCPFNLEDGFMEIPYQCLMRYAQHKLPKSDTTV